MGLNPQLRMELRAASALRTLFVALREKQFAMSALHLAVKEGRYTVLVEAAREHCGTPVWKRQLMILARWLHIYLSMASFGVLFFFAITGLTLNHADWFAKQEHKVQVRGVVDSKYVAKEVAKLEVVEYFRNTRGIHGAVKDFRVEDTDCSVSFKGPGYAADVLIDRATRRYQLTETPPGAVLCYLAYVPWVP